MAKEDEGAKKGDLLPNFTPAKREAQDRPKGRMAESPVDDQHVDAPKHASNAQRHRGDLDRDRRDLLEERPSRDSETKE